jgi:hypothetical protein
MLESVQWLVISIGLSVVLTVLLNVLLRTFPDAGRRAARGLEAFIWRSGADPRRNDRGVRVVVPWKAMIIASVILTIVVNIALRLV